MAAENVYDAGDILVTAEFKDPVTGALVDPEVVVCSARPPEAPAEDVVTPEVTKLSTGKYQAKVTADRAGRWFYAFDAAGDYRGSREGSFTVRAQYVPR